MHASTTHLNKDPKYDAGYACYTTCCNVSKEKSTYGKHIVVFVNGAWHRGDRGVETAIFNAWNSDIQGLPEGGDPEVVIICIYQRSNQNRV